MRAFTENSFTLNGSYHAKLTLQACEISLYVDRSTVMAIVMCIYPSLVPWKTFQFPAEHFPMKFLWLHGFPQEHGLAELMFSRSSVKKKIYWKNIRWRHFFILYGNGKCLVKFSRPSIFWICTDLKGKLFLLSSLFHELMFLWQLWR